MNHGERSTRIAISINSPRPHIPVGMLGCQSRCGMSDVPNGESRSEGGKGDFIPRFVSHRLDYSPQVNGIRRGYGAGSREWANPDFRGSTGAPPLVELKRSHRGTTATRDKQYEKSESELQNDSLSQGLRIEDIGSALGTPQDSPTLSWWYAPRYRSQGTHVYLRCLPTPLRIVDQ